MDENSKKPVSGKVEKEKEEELAGLGDLSAMGGLVDLFSGLFTGGREEGAGAVITPSEISGKSFLHWTDLPHVKELKLKYCTNLSDKELKSLLNLSNLEVLDLSGSHITGDAFKYTKDFTSVRELILFNCPFLNDKGLKHLSHLPNLEVLKISGALITGSCFKEWKPLKNLRELVIAGCPKLVDKNLRYLNELTALEKIDLSAQSPAP